MNIDPTANGVRSVEIRIGAARYEAVVGSNLLATIGERAEVLVRGPRCAVVVDGNTATLFAAGVCQSLQAAGFEPTVITIPSGENSKSLEQAGAVCAEMAAAELDRTSFVVALGGGVVGDLAGFAAAIYHRGIPHLQIPTSLLAQVDSSIGGKTAVNMPTGKNLLGAVHQPVLVIADTETLQTLPPRELNQGFAEIVKHAVIADASLLEVAKASGLRPSENASWNLALPDLVARNVEIKAAIVARDEHDRSGARAILNFGHTVGHAIERAAGYGRFLHGEAISLGIAAACEVSVRRAGLREEERERVVETLEAFHLPTRLPTDFPRAAIMPALASDKKFEHGEVRFVVTSQLGSARVARDVTMGDIAAAIDTL